MIEISKFKLLSGSVAVTGVYSSKGVPSLKCKVVPDEHSAENIVKKWQKEILREKISKFLNHRDKVWDVHMVLRTQRNAEIWTTVKRNFDFLYDKPLESNCHFVIRNRQYLESIMPGPKSRFYEHTRRTMDEIYAFCESKTITL